MNSIAKSLRCGVTSILISAAAAGSSASPVFLVSAPSEAVGIGATFTVDVRVVGAIDLYDYQFNLNYNPMLFQMAGSAIEGSFLSDVGPTIFFPGVAAAGTVAFVLGTLLGPGGGASGDGLLVSFGFTSLRAGVGNFSLSEFIAENSIGNSLAVTAVPAQVSVNAVAEPSVLALVAMAALAGWTARRSEKRKASSVRGGRNGTAA